MPKIGGFSVVSVPRPRVPLSRLRRPRRPFGRGRQGGRPRLRRLLGWRSASPNRAVRAAAVFDFLKQAYAPGEGTLVSSRDNPWKQHDHVYEKDDWVMYYNTDVPYFGLVARLRDIPS